MAKKRVKFSIQGRDTLMRLLRDTLIQRGYELVDTYENKDFVIWDGSDNLLDATCAVLLLSSDEVYSDRDTNLDVREVGVMSEDSPLILSSVTAENAYRFLHYLSAENEVVTATKNYMILRMFPVYGPNLHNNLVEDLMLCAKYRAMQYPNPGYQLRTFLHQDDFLEMSIKMIELLLKGHTGIYNMGSPEPISIKRLADSCWQLIQGVDGPDSVVTVPPERSYRWWVIPDMTRTLALTRCKPRSIRKGLWELIEGNKPAWKPKRSINS